MRGGWRAGAFLAFWILCSGIIGSIVVGTVRLWNSDGLSRVEDFAAGSAVSLFSAVLVGWLCGRLLEDLPYKALGTAFSRNWLKHLFLGLVVGGSSLSFAVLIAASFGNFNLELNRSVDPVQLIQSFAISFIVFAFGAAWEEAFFRGYMFQTLSRAGYAWIAIALTAVVFGFVHIGNPNSGAISTATTIIAGILFGFAYLKSRDLWFPFGIHLMWNWMQGSVFGIEVSGLTDLSAVSMLKEIDNGPEWLTGGSYGIEGGIASTIALVVTGTAIYFMPFVKPEDEMLALSSQENPKVPGP